MALQGLLRGLPMKTTEARSQGIARMTRVARGLRIGLGVLGALSLYGMEATGADVPAAGSSGSGLEEIVVTAERRESTIQGTPISITAVSGTDIASQGASSIVEVMQQVAGVSGLSAGPGQTQYEMRGMTPGAVGGVGGIASTVGFYIDDVSISPPASGDYGRISVDPSTYDLARVEVLRGPQGTLYGSGSMGGTVKLVSNLPDLTGFDSSVQLILGATSGGDPSYGGNAMLNVPLGTDRAALRLVGGYQEYSGWIDRVVIEQPEFPAPAPGEARGDVANAPVEHRYQNYNDTAVTMGRASLLFKVTDNLDIIPRIEYHKIDQDGSNAHDSIPSGADDVIYRPFDIRVKYEDELKSGGLTLDFHNDAVNVTSITGSFRRDINRREDNSEGFADLYGISYYTTDGLGVGPLSPTEEGNAKQFTQELRVASANTGKVSWLVGGYYSKFDYEDRAILASPAFTDFVAYGPGYFWSDVYFDFDTKNKIEEKAAFATVTLALPHDLELRAGGRYYHFDTNYELRFSGTASGSPEPTLSTTNSSESGFSPSVTLSYKPSRDFTGYATYSEGFRPGSGNFPIPEAGVLGAICKAELEALGLDHAPSSYKSDSVSNYELGEKLRVMDGNLTINGAVYQLEWSGVQTPVILGSQCGANFVVNAADARVTGGEVEVRWGIGSGFTLGLAAAYKDARFTQNNLAANVQKDDPLFAIPDWTTTEYLDYQRTTSFGTLFARATHTYVDDRPYTVNYPVLPSQSLVNLRFGWDRDSYSVDMQIDNVFDDGYVQSTHGTICCGIPNGYNLLETNRPRTLTVQLNKRF